MRRLVLWLMTSSFRVLTYPLMLPFLLLFLTLFFVVDYSNFLGTGSLHYLCRLFRQLLRLMPSLLLRKLLLLLRFNLRCVLLIHDTLYLVLRNLLLILLLPL